MNTYKKEMGKRLKAERKKYHLTQENIAEMLDISVKHYSEVERGITGLSIENIIKISNILNVTTDYLLKGITVTDNDSFLNFFNNLSNDDSMDLLNIINLIQKYKNK